MPDVLRIVEQFSIITDQDKATATLRVLKEGDTFAVFDRHGDVIPAEAGQAGLYHAGTRYLSHFELLLGRRRPTTDAIGTDQRAVRPTTQKRVPLPPGRPSARRLSSVTSR